MSQGKRRSSRFLAGLAATLIGLGFALLAAEGLVRLFFDEPLQPRFVIDAGYGVRANQPGIRTRHYVPGDYEVEINTNSAGMRGTREYQLRKPEDVYRVLVLGDSFAFGFGVEDEEVVSAVLEDKLNQSAGKGQRFEVLNLSVSGFGQAEELLTYRHAGRQYDPDAVVLFYFQNDVGNNAVSGLFEIGEDGELHRTDQDYLPAVEARERLYAIPMVRWLFEHSAAWNLVRNRLSSLVQKSLLKNKGLKEFSDTQPEAVELTKALIREFVAEIKADGARAIIVAIPHKASARSNFPLSPAEVREIGAEFLDAQDFVTAADYYERDSHWRPSGHRLASQRIAALLQRQ